MAFWYYARVVVGLAIYGSIGGLIVHFLSQAGVSNRVRRVYWSRYALLCGALLAALPILATWFASPILFGLLVLEHVQGWDMAWKFALVTWASFMAAFMVVDTYRVIELNCSARFIDPSETYDAAAVAATAAQPLYIRWLVVVALGLWIPLWCAGVTINEYVAAQAQRQKQPVEVAEVAPGAFGPMHATLQVGGGIGLGLMAVVATLALLNWLQSRLFSTSVHRAGFFPFERAGTSPNATFSTWFARALSKLGPGYVDAATQAVRPGHAQLALLMAILLLVYIGLYSITWYFSAIPSDGDPFTAIFFLLLTITMLGFMVTALSFFLDLSHVPTLLLLTVMVVGSHWVFDPYHGFELRPDLEGSNSPTLGSTGQAPRSPRVEECVADWRFPDGSKDEGSTLVVVAAAGGGIQAAAWTAQVLTGLDEEFEGFSECVGLASGVSGGSVGLMYYVHKRGDRNDDPAQPMRISRSNRDTIRRMAAASSLEATAWGVTFPDLVRFLFPPVARARFDRGWALEMDWRKRLTGDISKPDDTRLGDWANSIGHHRMPIVAFNAAFADTGASLVISPAVAQLHGGPSENLVQALEYYAPFRPNLRITTGARLSAAFSYVSPISRALAGERLSGDELANQGRLNHRVADGGYVDNSGLLTATRFLARIVEGSWDRGKPPTFRNVLFLRILPFPVAAPQIEDDRPDRRDLLWEVFGPIVTLNSTRQSSQIARSDWEMELLVHAFQNRQQQLRRRIDERVNAELAKLASDLEGQDPQVANRVKELAAKHADSESDNSQRLEAARTITDQAPAIDPQTKAAASETIDRLDQAVQYWPSVRVFSLTLQPEYHDGESAAPLSWKLTPGEKQSIVNAWGRIVQAIRERQPAKLPAPGEPLAVEHLKLFFKHAPDDQ